MIFLETDKTKKKYVYAHYCIMHGICDAAGLCASAAVTELNTEKSRPEHGRDFIFY